MQLLLVKELRLAVVLLLALAIIFHSGLGLFWALPVYAALIFLCFIARQLPRQVEAEPLTVRSPIDGVVVDVQYDLKHPWMKADEENISLQRIRIRQHRLGEFVLHSPIEGKVLERWWPDKAGSGAKDFGFVVQADEGDRCVVDIVNAARPRFKTHFIPAGYRTRQGQRCGLIGMGVLADVYIAESALLKIEAGDQVKAGSDVLANFCPHHLTR